MEEMGGWHISRNYGMEKVARGVYITDDVWPDELYIMQVYVLANC